MNKFKWMGMWLLVPVMSGLVGCGSDKESAEQARAADQFQQAGRHLKAVSDGYVGDKTSADLAEYQLQQLIAAGKQYAEIQNTGSPGQQVSAAMGLAEANATAARHLTRQAVDTWSKLSPISKHAVPTLTAARSAWTLTEAHRKLDQSVELQQAQQQADLARGQLQVAEGRLKELQTIIDDLTAQRDGRLAQRARLIAQADDFNRRSFEATGQLRFDLYAQAAEVTRQAEQLGVEADKLAARINVEQSRRRVVEIEAAQAQDRIAGVAAVIESFAQRRKQIGSTAQQTQAEADQLAEQLVQILQQRAEQHTQQVQQPLDQSRQLMSEAVAALRQAATKSRDSTPAVRLALAVKGAEAAHLLRQAASIHRGHADLMQLMASKTAEGFPPQQAELIRSLAEQAAHLAEQSKADAVTALQQAADDLSQAADAQRDQTLAQGARQQLLEVYDALIAITDQPEWGAKADELRLQLNPPAAPPEGGTAPPAQPEGQPPAPAQPETAAPPPTQPEAAPQLEAAPPQPETAPQPEAQPQSETAPAPATAGPAGYWGGQIQVPNAPLDIQLHFEAAPESGWTGTIDIPAQGVAGFPLGELAVNDAAISFNLPGIPGDPSFSGQLADDGQSITGQFTQGGQTFPFNLQRGEPPQPETPQQPQAPAPSR